MRLSSSMIKLNRLHQPPAGAKCWSGLMLITSTSKTIQSGSMALLDLQHIMGFFHFHLQNLHLSKITLLLKLMKLPVQPAWSNLVQNFHSPPTNEIKGITADLYSGSSMKQHIEYHRIMQEETHFRF